jgi:hypothetical protein
MLQKKSENKGANCIKRWVIIRRGPLEWLRLSHAAGRACPRGSWAPKFPLVEYPHFCVHTVDGIPTEKRKPRRLSVTHQP